MSPPIWKWSPNWAAGVDERLEWKTAIQVARDGTESRQKLRPVPRVAISFQTLVHGEEYQEMSMLLQAHQAEEWLMPLWWDVSEITNLIGSIIDFDDTGRDFSKAEAWRWIVLYNPASGEWGEAELKWDDSLINNWTTQTAIDPAKFGPGTKIYPARRVLLSASQPLSQVTAGVVTLGVECRVVEPYGRGANAAPLALETMEPNRIRPVDAAFESMVGALDFGVGKFGQKDYAKRPFRSVKHDYLLTSRAELWEMRGDLLALSGRFGELRVPTFQVDLRSMLDIDFLNYVYIYASPVGFMALFESGAVAPALYIKPTRSGYSPVIAEVDGVQSNDVNSEEIEFDPPLPVTFKKNEVKISLVYNSRLSSDTIEINHITPEVSEVSIGYRSLK